MINRRHFGLSATGLAFAGLAELAAGGAARVAGYGPLVADPAGMLDLPRGFAYRVIASRGDAMTDGLRVPDRADGMGAFRLDADRTILVRNHELSAKALADGPSPKAGRGAATAFDRNPDGQALPGGTTTLIYNHRTGRTETQWLSLAGTIRNCAGGTTPWGSWLSCEEDMTRAGEKVGEDHGWVFEVPAGKKGLAEPLPLKAMGRFNHEAAAVDPATGIVYMTEDREDGLFYRFLPNARGALHKGGRLQALGLVTALQGSDSRNRKATDFATGVAHRARWIDLDEVESPADNLRQRGHRKGATLFARGEGVHFGRGELFFCCTSGGQAKLGQVMRYRPSRFEGQAGEAGEPGRLALFVESRDAAAFNYGDNLTVAPNGHLIVCEDQYTPIVQNHLRGVTPAGALYDFARLRWQTELAGACFSPDGKTLFVNVYSPTRTLAITGPWGAFVE
jgi:secreted PhoX family phosphatase